MKGSHYRAELHAPFTASAPPASHPYKRIFEQQVRGPDRREEHEARLTEIANAMAAQPGRELSQLCPPAGYTYFGQFVDHDVSEDQSSLDDLLADSNAARNARSAKLDLDHLYGRGPLEQPELYEDGQGRFKIGKTERVQSAFGDVWESTEDDLFRQKDGDKWVTSVADKRADQNLLLAQMHVAFMKAHNRLLTDDQQLNSPYYQQATTRFDKARLCLTWHYQWLVVNDFLPKWTRIKTVDGVIGNRLYFDLRGPGGEALMPIEVSAAALRIGHTMVRPAYFLKMMLRPMVPLKGLCTTLVGRPIPADSVIDWPLFFAQGPGGKHCFANALDTHVATPLSDLEGLGFPPLPNVPSLSARSLIRGSRLGLPTGQQLAAVLGTTPLPSDNLRATSAGDLLESYGMLDRTPLFYYILAEAEFLGTNQDNIPATRMGPLGGRLVSGTLIGLLVADSNSYLAAQKYGWSPTMFSTQPASKLLGLIKYSQGV